jgi:tetratricopeptide (TPR) repeat protein
VLFDEATARLESGEPAAAIVQTTAEGMAEALFNLATILHQQAAILQQQNVGRSTLAALSYARMALVLRPNLSVCQALVAEILDGLGHGEAAVAMYESIEKGSPFHWLARMRVAISLDAEGETDEAVARLAAMAEERPERSDALVTMGDIYRAKERFAEAVDAYTRAVERIDTLEERHWSLLYARGISLERSGEWQRAETDFLRALELRPDQPYVLNYLGYSWVSGPTTATSSTAWDGFCSASACSTNRSASSSAPSSSSPRTPPSTTTWATCSGRWGGATRPGSSGAARSPWSPTPSWCLRSKPSWSVAWS